MNTENLKPFLTGIVTGILLTTTASGFYCLYFRKRKNDSKSSESAPCNLA